MSCSVFWKKFAGSSEARAAKNTIIRCDEKKSCRRGRLEVT